MTDSNLVSNAVVASQSSQYISIVPENGEQFKPNGKIIYNIEPELGYIKQDSYLVFDVVNNSPSQARYTLCKNLGAHALIDRVDIYSKETGILLESTTNYSQFVNVEHQYLFDDHTNLSNTQGVGHPVQSWKNTVNSATAKTTTRSIPSAHRVENNQLSPVNNVEANGGEAVFTSRRFCIPLKVGLFGHFDAQEKLIPVANFGGLRIEITLQKPELAMERLGASVLEQTPNEDDHRFTYDFTQRTKGMLAADANTQAGNAFCDIKIMFPQTPLSKQGILDTRNLGLIVGNSITLYDDDADSVGLTGPITNITKTTSEAVVIDGKEENLWTHITIRFTVAAGPAQIVAATSAFKINDNTPNYAITNSEFRLLQIVPPPNVADQLSKGLNYEFTSYEVFLDNIPQASLRHQIPINSVASKALALFTILYPSNTSEPYSAAAHGVAGGSTADYYNGILPEDCGLKEVVYFINNRLYPLRSYNPQSRADRCLALNELVKSFRAISKEPMALGNADYGGLEAYTFTPLIARELARNGMVFDIRNAEPELRLNFSAARSNDVGILRANTYVFSKKIIQSSPTGVQVIH